MNYLLIDELIEVNGLHIKRTCTNTMPYIKLEFSKKKITKTQKELIYILFVEEEFFKLNFFHKENLIEIILSEDYNSLYNCSIHDNHSIIISYLLSHSLVEGNVYLKNKYHVFPPERITDNKAIKDYYLAMINANIIITNPSIFFVREFAQIIKYPDEFIDNNFRDFAGGNYFGCKNIFLSVKTQKPIFETLIRHIGEFNVDYVINNIPLTKEQINQLVLLNQIIGEHCGR